MSFLAKVLFLAYVLVVAAKPMTESERQAMFGELIAKCKASEGVSDDEVQAAIANTPPSSRAAQCFHACMMESIGIMVGGKLSVDAGVKLAEKTGDPAKIKNSQIVAQECHSVGAGDRCDSAVEILQCVGQAAAKHGFDPSKDLN